MVTKYSVHGPEKHKSKGITTNFFIRIEEGPYTGVEYTYLDVRNNGVDEEENYHLTFDYDVLYSPLDQVVQEDFEKVMWEILKEILIQTANAIQDGEPELAVIDELDTTKPDEFALEEIIPDVKPETA